MPLDLDALFGAGADLSPDVVVKAQLRFRARPPRHPAARDVVDRVVHAYDERLDMIVGEIAEVLQHVDRRRSHDQPLVVAVDSVAKATPHTPYRPGSRGGKWYRDSRGNIRYGDPPEGRFMGNSTKAPSMPREGIPSFHSAPFMGAYGNDQALTGYLLEHGGAHGFSDHELRFLGAWYGNGEDGGALFGAFLECAQLTRDDLRGGVANLRFGSQQLTYEEAVFEFFAAQGSLFMGEEPSTNEQLKEWNRVLHDEIKPLLTGVFAKYEEAKGDEDLQQQFVSEPARQRRRFFDRARRYVDDVGGVADAVLGDWNPDRQVDVAIAGMRALGLLVNPPRAERHAYLHGRPHLRDAVMIDGRLLGDGRDNPLVGDEGRLVSLSSSQLMLTYVAAELYRRWDPHSRSFSAEAQDEIGHGELGEKLLSALSNKDPRWSEASDMVRDHLGELVDRLVIKLNKVNAREGLPTKRGPARSKR